MAKYLPTESRDPFDSNDVAKFHGLARDGNEVGLQESMATALD